MMFHKINIQQSSIFYSCLLFNKLSQLTLSQHIAALGYPECGLTYFLNNMSGLNRTWEMSWF